MARFPRATWRGTPNRTAGGMIAHVGLVLHIEEGTEAGTDSWFNDPKSQASAHFGVGKAGGLDQWVDTDDKAWAEVAGNPQWVSVECEGHTGDSLTGPQVENIAQLFAWLHGLYGIPLRSTDSPNGGGLGWHGMGGQAWGGHFDCPGDPIKQQRPQIIARATELVGGVRPMYDPPLHLQPIVASLAHPGGGSALLAADGSVYDFDAPYNGGCNGKPYFAGRTASRLELRPGAAGTTADPWYRVVATSGEKYGDGGF